VYVSTSPEKQASISGSETLKHEERVLSDAKTTMNQGGGGGGAENI